jgi:heptosyltransferase-3
LINKTLSQLPSQPFPADPRRIVLLNPTKYLGNLLLAGGLIQDFAEHCRHQNREFLIVLDAAFEELCSEALVGIPVLWYPRQAIRHAKLWRKLTLAIRFLARLRAFRPELAFNIEEDSLASRLTQLSGAGFRLGCSPKRHRVGYEHVLPIAYDKRHRWYSYQDVFTVLGLPAKQQKTYMNLHIYQCSAALIQKLGELGVRPDVSLVAIHPAATKNYKKWPESAFIHLCNLLINNGFKPVLLGAGRDELQSCERIRQSVADDDAGRPLNLCNQLSLAELAGFFRLCTGMAGNDSGPSHLASAQDVPGVVIFGPSEPAIWGPVGARSQVLRKAELCDPRCSRRECFQGYRCLQEISPHEVLNALTVQIQAAGAP